MWHLNWLSEGAEAVWSLISSCILSGLKHQWLLPCASARSAATVFTGWALKSLSHSFSLSASHNPLHTSHESTWAFRKGHTHTHTQTHTHTPTQKAHTSTPAEPPAYSGIRTASFSLCCGNSLITDGWERILPHTMSSPTEKKHQLA